VHDFFYRGGSIRDLTLPPEYLIVVCKFKGKIKPTEARIFLAGRLHQKYYAKKRLGLPEKIEEKFGSRLIAPLHFAYIKFPIKRGGYVFKASVGAIMVYQVVTAEMEIFKELCRAIYEELGKRFEEFEIMTAETLRPEFFIG